MRSLTIRQFDKLDYAATEALNTLCTNLSFSGMDVKRIMLTSCLPKEGKSFISINLMRAFAQLGKRVVLVDADLRKSVLRSRYAIQISGDYLGLSHFLAGMCSMEHIVFSSNVDGAHLILAGKDVANPLTLLNSPRFSKLLDALAEQYDVVLVDAPPIGAVIDAARIAQACDGVLFVVASDVNGRRELSQAKQQIEKTGCPILGAVLNKITFDSYSSKRYYNRAYYSSYEHSKGAAARERETPPRGAPPRAAKAAKSRRSAQTKGRPRSNVRGKL